LNFDKFISERYGDLIAVNPDSFGTWGYPNNGDSKYGLKKLGAVTKTFSADTNGENDIEEFNTKIFKIITNTIPFKKYVGESIYTNLYLNPLQVNSIGAVLGSIPNNINFTNPEDKSKSHNIAT
jgi:hypothetical protein